MSHDDLIKLYVPRAHPEATCPYDWGDLVHIKDAPASHYEFIYMPDNDYCEAETYIISQGKNEFGFWQTAQRQWNQLTKISPLNCCFYEELLTEFQHNRQCFCINSWKWTFGLTFHIPWGKYAKLAEQYILFPETKFNVDDSAYLSLTKRFWSSDKLFWRVIYHENDDDNGWRMEGPFEHKQEAERVYCNILAQALKSPPQMIRHGIYKNSGQINGVFLYQGPYIKKKNCLLIGQGEPLQNSNGINAESVLL